MGGDGLGSRAGRARAGERRSEGRTSPERLPFDPTQEFHDYAFFYDRGSITFYVDGKPLKRYEGGLPDRPMRLHVNSWYPAWLDGREPDSDRHVYVDWLEH